MQKYFRYWYFFLIGLILSATVASLYLRYYATPQYSISSSLLIKADNSRSNISANSAFGEEKASTTKNINDEIQMLKSRSLMQRVMNELSLYVSYHIKGSIKDKEVYGKNLPIKITIDQLDSAVYDKPFSLQIKSDKSFELREPDGQSVAYDFGQKIQKKYGVFTVEATKESLFTKDIMPRDLIFTFVNTQQLAEQYSRNFSVLPVNKDANVLNLNFIDPIPERGVDIMNKLLEVYNKEALEDKNLLATNTLAFIDERLKRITVALNGVEKTVEQYKRQNEVSNVDVQTSNYLEQVSDYSKKLSDWDVQIDILESIENYLGKNAGQYKMVPSTLGLQDQTLLDLIAKFNNLQLERERMLRTAQLNNPLVQNMNEQLGQLRVNILENLRNIKNGLIITRQNLKVNSGKFKEQIKKVPSIERELLDINRQQAIKQNLYVYLLQKREEAALALAATLANSKVIDNASASDGPISPNPKLVYLLAMLFGLGLPFTLIRIKDNLNEKIQSKQDVELLTTVPILGEISHNKFETVVVTKGNSSPIAEMFGLIRAHLNTATAHKENKVLLVTSSMSGEGKTFFSINLAASLALTGKKVVVMELDFRAPDLMQEIGVRESTGISDYLLSDDVSIVDIITPADKVQNLFVAGSGSLPLYPAELMTSPKLAYLINELKVSFDYIVIDTAPIGQVADAFSLGPLTDTTIYLMRYNYTLKGQVELVDGILKNKTLPNPLIVLNDAKKQNGKGYGYGYGYSQNKKKSGKRLIKFS